MNVTNFKEKPYFDSLPRYTLPALQAAFDKAESKSFSGLAIYNGLCRDLDEVGHEKPTQQVFNAWLDGVQKGQIARPGGAKISEEQPTDPSDDHSDHGEYPTDAKVRRVTRSGEIRIDGVFFKAGDVPPGTDVVVRADPRDENRFAMFGLKDRKYLGEAVRQGPNDKAVVTGVDLATGPDLSATTVVTFEDGKPFFTPMFPAEEADTLVERMIAEAKADLSRDLEGRAKRLVAERLRLLAASIEGDAR